MPRMRLGVALLLPPRASAEVDGLRRAVSDPALDRIPPHITLVPPVNVDRARLAQSLAVLREAAASTPSLQLAVGPLATFWPTSPVVYLAVSGDLAALARMRETLLVPPLHRRITHPFVPHVTLIDGAEPSQIQGLVAALGSFTLEVRIDRVHLLQEGPGRVWTPIADATLEALGVVGRGGLALELALSERADPLASAWADRAWADHAAGPGADPGPADRPFAITARRAADAGEAHTDGSPSGIVGAAEGRVRGAEAVLDRLIVGQAQRRQGVGSHLLAAACSHCADAGATRMRLRTDLGGQAQSFYEARGWGTVAVLPAWRLGRDFVVMERAL